MSFGGKSCGMQKIEQYSYAHQEIYTPKPKSGIQSYVISSTQRVEVIANTPSLKAK